METDPPATTADDTASLWLWGTVWGYEAERYVATDPSRSVEVCADLYDKYGTEFVDRLNGRFLVLVYDHLDGDFHVATDNLGSHPLYTASSGDGVVFSTDLQHLARIADAPVDGRLMAEYLTTGRVSGCLTPFTGIEEVPPGTVETYVSGEQPTRRRYWKPRYRPLDKPFSWFVDRFVERFQTVMDDYNRPDKRHGVLLSGGSDSRLLVASPPSSATAYHMSDWEGPETRVAKQSAEIAGVPYVWLRRERDHHRRALDVNPAMMNFYGRFDQAHTTGFHTKLREECDVLVSGLYADTFFKGGAIPKQSVQFGPLGDLDLPVETSIESIEDFLDVVDQPFPEYLSESGSLADVIRPDLRRTSEGIEYRGVCYPSLSELAACWEFYPMSNDPDLFYYGLTKTMPHWTPFLDNRLIELSLAMPWRYQLRRNIINAALSRIAPDLASIPNARTGIAVSWPFPIQYAAARATSLRRQLLPGEPPKQYLGYGPWTPHAKLLQTESFGIETLVQNWAVIESLPYLSREGVLECYRDHMVNGNRQFELYILLGMLRMPLTTHLAKRYAGQTSVLDDDHDGIERLPENFSNISLDNVEDQ